MCKGKARPGRVAERIFKVKRAHCILPEQKPQAGSGNLMKPMRANGLSREEMEKYKRLLEDISEPNCGRIMELKEAIHKGTFLTKEAIQETAERIAARFLGRE